MGNIQIQILLSSIAFCLNTFLAILVVLKNRKSWTNRLFFNLAILANLYIIVNFLSLHPPTPTPESQLFWIRVVMFVCSFIGPCLVLLVHTFPYEKIRMKAQYIFILLCLMVLSASASLLPFVFKSISYPNGQAVPAPGPGIVVFFLDFVGLFILSFIILIVRYRQAQGEEKVKLKYLLLGVIASFSLMGLFTVVFVAILKNSAFVFLGPIFPVILMAFIAYAIVKHQLFDIKVIATEALTAVLGIILLSRIFIFGTPSDEAVDILIFLSFTVFGFFLIRSVRNEVRQREQLEALTKELGKANEKLKTLDQARAEFITIASHQLRTPPATIKWYLSAVLEGDYGKVPKKILEQLTKTQNTNNHLISLIEDMLNVSRIERGKMEFLFEQTDVQELAKFSYEQLLPIAGDKKLKLTYTPPTKALPKIMADKEKLRQVMNNLIDNALKYTKQGTVAVSLTQQGDEIKFCVKDSGKGISAEEQDEIFQKYSRGKESVKQSAGLGLGLYVAKIIIDQHKGKIWAESEGEGKGSSFCFSLPINNGLEQTTMVDLGKNNTPGGY
jgi:signal transduction histidine kinase